MMWMIKVKYGDGKGNLLGKIKPFKTRKIARSHISRVLRPRNMDWVTAIYPVKVKVTYTEIT